jgi:hypothetical protein
MAIMFSDVWSCSDDKMRGAEGLNVSDCPKRNNVSKIFNFCVKKQTFRNNQPIRIISVFRNKHIVSKQKVVS